MENNYFLLQECEDTNTVQEKSEENSNSLKTTKNKSKGFTEEMTSENGKEISDIFDYDEHILSMHIFFCLI